MFSPIIDSYTYISRAYSSSETGYVSGSQFIENRSEKGAHEYYSYHMSSWNTFGCIPIVRSISGTLRACLGVADVITGISLSIFHKNSEHMKIAQIGAKNIIRGAVEVACDVIFPVSVVAALFLHNNPVAGTLIVLVSGVGPSLALQWYDNSKDPKKTIIYEP